MNIESEEIALQHGDQIKRHGEDGLYKGVYLADVNNRMGIKSIAGKY